MVLRDLVGIIERGSDLARGLSFINQAAASRERLQRIASERALRPEEIERLRGTDAVRVRQALSRFGIRPTVSEVARVRDFFTQSRQTEFDPRYTNLNARINPSRMPYAITPIGNEYSYLVRVLVEDRDSGAQIEDHITVVSDVNLTVGEIKAKAADAAIHYGVDVEVVETVVESAIRRA